MIMMTSSYGNIFHVTDPLYREFTGNRWIPLTKARDVELWCFLWSAPWINGWINNCDAGDLRHHRAHYDIIVMYRCDTNVEVYKYMKSLTAWYSFPFPEKKKRKFVITFSAKLFKHIYTLEVVTVTISNAAASWWQKCHQNDISISVLTHFPLNKMAAISQMIFSNAFLWMKSFVFLYFNQNFTKGCSYGFNWQ